MIIKGTSNISPNQSGSSSGGSQSYEHNMTCSCSGASFTIVITDDSNDATKYDTYTKLYNYLVAKGFSGGYYSKQVSGGLFDNSVFYVLNGLYSDGNNNI